MRDNYATCPRCATALDPQGARLVCGTCTGAFVGELELDALIAELEDRVMPAPLALAPASPSEAAVRCPCCVTAMTKHALFGVIVDRCAAHGIWFDAHELQTMLFRVGEDRRRQKQRRTRVMLAWMGVLYVGSIAVQILVGAGA